jgi:thioredoxin-like negative regulator of GroEL
MGVHFGGEGLPVGARAPAVPAADFAAALTLVVFTSPTCEICAALLPSLRALERTYDEVAVAVVTHGDDSSEVFRAYNVSQTPYVVAVGHDGRVRGGGVANTLEQVEELVGSTLGQERPDRG